MERFDSGYRYLVPRGYDIATRRDTPSFEYGPCSNQEYRVYVSHGVFKFPANSLVTRVVQSAGVSVKRAFDVHLRCLNGFCAVAGSTNSRHQHGLTIPRRMSQEVVTRRSNVEDSEELVGIDGGWRNISITRFDP